MRNTFRQYQVYMLILWSCEGGIDGQVEGKYNFMHAVLSNPCLEVPVDDPILVHVVQTI